MPLRPSPELLSALTTASLQLVEVTCPVGTGLSLGRCSLPQGTLPASGDILGGPQLVGAFLASVGESQGRPEALTMHRTAHDMKSCPAPDGDIIQP